MIDAFLYAPHTHQRKHGPSGYLSYERYKAWLRDEFTFRCVYCLFRERWYPNGEYSFGVDHAISQRENPGLALSYDNLLYACNRCNAYKRDLEHFLDPCSEPFGHHIQILANGTVAAKTLAGKDLIDTLDLNEEETVASRRDFILFAHKLNEGQISDPEIVAALERYFAFPEDLPDLTIYRPSKNTRPDGLKHTYFAKRTSKTLPHTY